MKKLFVIVFGVVASMFLHANEGFAVDLIVDNDAAAGQPGTSYVTNGSWTYLKAGYYGDSRISYQANARYTWQFRNGNIKNAKYYAYINNYSFTANARYDFGNQYSGAGTKTINQNYAPGGWNYIGTFPGATSNFRVQLTNLSGGQGCGADAMMIRY